MNPFDPTPTDGPADQPRAGAVWQARDAAEGRRADVYDRMFADRSDDTDDGPTPVRTFTFDPGYDAHLLGTDFLDQDGQYTEPMGPLTRAAEQTRLDVVTRDLERRLDAAETRLHEGLDLGEDLGPDGEWTGVDGRLYRPRPVGWDDVTHPEPALDQDNDEFGDDDAWF